MDCHHIPTSAIYVFLGHLQISYAQICQPSIRLLPAPGAKEEELDPLPWLNVSALISLTAVICPVIIFKIVKRRLIPNLDFLQALVIIKKKFCHPLTLIFKLYFLISYVKAQFPKISTSKQTKHRRLREAPHNDFRCSNGIWP